MVQKSVKQSGNAILDKASRYEKNGWIFVHMKGQPFERGYQHGYLLAQGLSTVRAELVSDALCTQAAPRVDVLSRSEPRRHGVLLRGPG